MPTFYDPSADAREASESMRGLAHASHTFEHQQDMYGILGDLLSGVRSLRQVLDQLATAHASNRSRAFDDHGDHAEGTKHALAAADELHQAAALIDQAQDRLDVAMSAAGRIAWHADPLAEQTPVRRWVSIVFLQGEEADAVLNMIDADGVDAALGHLKGWDYGEETTNAAMENGHVYEQPPASPLEREFRDGDYHLSYSHSFGYVALYRLHTIDPDDALPDELASRGAPAPPQDRPVQSERSWFEHSGITAVKQQRGLGL